MYHDTIEHFAELAKNKVTTLSNNPLAFFIGALMAGAYVGIGIILIFSVGGGLEPAWQKLVMGASFGIALTLVVFAGSELFTGHTMYMVFGKLKGLTGWGDLAKVWAMAWIFNLLGSVGLALLFALGGGGSLLHDGSALLFEIADYKMNSSILALIARATLCNWLVCLALWMAARSDSDTAKAIVIFWCLFAFIASGFEHSVANMTLLSIALLGNHPETVTVAGMAYNLLWVTVGNIIGGSLFMGLGYWFAAHRLVG
ncbi:MAG: nitrite transporter NirC [Pseudomonadales bacterium]|nr:nitrite transporter NirC [Pseudomonadales bacterium]MBL6813740.1 nitrite transporter NirC [Pseudomonadales bacterium]